MEELQGKWCNYILSFEYLQIKKFKKKLKEILKCLIYTTCLLSTSIMEISFSPLKS